MCRCYFRCSYSRERGCPATKQVQQCSHGDPPQYAVIYVNEHTCDTAAWEPEAAAPTATNNPLLDLPGLLGGERGVQEEHERQVLVSSLATVLGAHSPVGSSSSSVAFGHDQQQHASAIDPRSAELPRVDVDSELDIMDYGEVGSLYITDSYGLPAQDGLQF